MSRKFIGMYFRCCRLYTRIYINRAGTAYEGHCPGCMNHARVRISPGGTSNRFFKGD